MVRNESPILPPVGGHNSNTKQSARRMPVKTKVICAVMAMAMTVGFSMVPVMAKAADVGESTSSAAPSTPVDANDVNVKIDIGGDASAALPDQVTWYYPSGYLQVGRLHGHRHCN